MSMLGIAMRRAAETVDAHDIKGWASVSYRNERAEVCISSDEFRRLLAGHRVELTHDPGDHFYGGRAMFEGVLFSTVLLEETNGDPSRRYMTLPALEPTP